MNAARSRRPGGWWIRAATCGLSLAATVAARPSDDLASEGDTATSAPALEDASGAGDEIDWSQFEAVPDDGDDAGHVDGRAGGPGVLDRAADLLRELREDPTLDGRISFYYSAIYRGRFHQFDDVEFPFPNAVTPDDQQWARELRRRRDDQDDHDLDQYFSLSWRELLAPESDSWWQKVDVEASGRYFKDLDGSPAGEETLDTFDALSGNDQLRVTTLHATGEVFDRHLEVRAGRQHVRDAEWVHFDGAQLRFRGLTVFDREVELSAFGGARVRYFRRASSEHVGVGGATIRMWPWEGASVRLSDVWFVDNSLEAELRQRFEIGYAAITYRQINEDPQSVWVDLHIDWDEVDLSCDLGYRGKLGAGADDFDFDFTRSRRRDPSGTEYLWFGDLAPYDEASLDLRQGFLEHWGAFLGGTVHQLRERKQRDEWSTDWQEAWAGVDVSHAPWRGFTGRATVRYLHTDLRRRIFRLDAGTAIGNGTPDFQAEDITGDGEPDFLGLELLAEQDFARVIAAGVVVVVRGYDYQSNYAFLEDLTASSASIYVRWNATARTQWRLSYAYDRDFQHIAPDLEALHTVRVQFTYRF